MGNIRLIPQQKHTLRVLNIVLKRRLFEHHTHMLTLIEKKKKETVFTTPYVYLKLCITFGVLALRLSPVSSCLDVFDLFVPAYLAILPLRH